MDEAEQAARQALLERYRLFRESLGQLGLIVTGVLLSYHTLAVETGQLERLLEGQPPPDVAFDPAPYRLASSALFIKASSYFYGLSLQSLEQASEEGRAALELDALINAMALSAAALRLYFLLGLAPNGGETAAGETAAGEAAVPQAEAVVE